MSLEFKTLQPTEFYKQHIDAGVRPDGRSLQERRTIALSAGSVSTADGSAVVRQGRTGVVCGVRAELASPKPDQPDKGYLVPNITMPPMCSPAFKPGPPSLAAQTASQFLVKVLETSGCITPGQLCISPGKLVWCLYIDLVCLDHDGNVWDAAVAAMISALETVRLPEVNIDVETGDITVVSDDKQLELQSRPVACTVAVFPGSEEGESESRLLVDPTWEEEQLASCCLTVVCLPGDKEVEVCHIRQPGGAPLTPLSLQQAIKLATSHAETVKSSLLK